MKYFLYALIVSVLLFASCTKCTDLTDIPRCINETIQANKNDERWMYASIDEYRYQGKLVYAFTPDNSIIADGATMVQTDDCNTLCSVGGFGGPSVVLCNGQDFFKNAVLVRRIWEK